LEGVLGAFGLRLLEEGDGVYLVGPGIEARERPGDARAEASKVVAAINQAAVLAPDDAGAVEL
jgi:hypothetical protein